MSESTATMLYERFVPVSVVSYYLPRIFFLAGLQKAVFRNFNEIAFFGQAAVWGVTVSQIFQYFFNYPDDPPKLKTFVAILWCLGAAHQGLTTYLVVSLLLNGVLTPTYEVWTLIWPDPTSSSLFNLAFFLMALVSIFAQSFYIYQIWIFASNRNLLTRSRSFLIPIFLAPLVLFQLVLPSIMLHNTSAFAGIDYYKPSKSVLDRFHIQQNLFLATLVVNVGINWTTFVGLAIHLRKSYFGPCLAFERKMSVIWRAVFFTVNTGMWAALYSILTLAMFCIIRVGSTYIVLHFHFLSAIYCSSILANLNARDYLHPTGNHAYLPPPPPKPMTGQTGIINGRPETMAFQRTVASDFTTSEI